MKTLVSYLPTFVDEQVIDLIECLQMECGFDVKDIVITYCHEDDLDEEIVVHHFINDRNLYDLSDKEI